MPVVSLAVKVSPPRLIAMKPRSPREKAMALAPSSHQLAIGVPATTLRNATIAAILGSRCSHTQSPTLASSRPGAHATSFVAPLASEGGPMAFCAGRSKA
jgi:hypothetical protein